MLERLVLLLRKHSVKELVLEKGQVQQTQTTTKLVRLWSSKGAFYVSKPEKPGWSRYLLEVREPQFPPRTPRQPNSSVFSLRELRRQLDYHSRQDYADPQCAAPLSSALCQVPAFTARVHTYRGRD